MNLATSKRLDGISEYYFSHKLREIGEMNKAGKNVINLGIGNPDLPPHPEVIKVLQDASSEPDVHTYQSYKGSPILRCAIAEWYKKWYDVELNADTEILPLIGSKEGIMHICMTYLNEKDKVLLPNPGYPTYKSSVKLAGGDCVEYKLTAANDWLPDLTSINTFGVKLMFVNYPHMPTGKMPNPVFFEQLIAFARKNNILIIHDNPYSFTLNKNPMSLLSIEGAKEVVIELNSLSKSQNMAGWRVGMMIGAKERIDEILCFKSNMDSGMFLPVQLAAAKALSVGKDWYDHLNSIYENRRRKVFKLLDFLNCNYSKDQVGMFVWAAVPSKYKTGFELSDEVLYNANVFITSGGIFGSAGDKYVRVSLCSNECKIEESIVRIRASLKI